MTGGSRGIGFEVFKKLLQCDMTVVLGVRNPDDCKTSLEKLIDFEAYKDRIVILQIDVGEMDSVREFTTKVQEKFESINILINNGKFGIFKSIDFKLILIVSFGNQRGFCQPHTRSQKTALCLKWQ